jgi:secretion/DNA translocation related TadE-like protein
MSSPRRRDEDGAVTSLVLVVAAALVVVTVGAAAAGQLMVAHRRAGSAADLGALAGAVALQRGADGCAAARRLVVRSDARLRRCEVSDEQVRVTVAVELTLAGRRVDVGARAHAGPR